MISFSFVITAIVGFLFINAVKNTIKPILFVILIIVLAAQYENEAKVVLEKAINAGQAAAPYIEKASQISTKALNDFLEKDPGYDLNENDDNVGSAMAQEIFELK